MSDCHASNYRTSAEEPSPERFCAECFHPAHDGHRCPECKRTCLRGKVQPWLFAAAIVSGLLYCVMFTTYADRIPTDERMEGLAACHLFLTCILWCSAMGPKMMSRY